ncbi:MAG: transcription initiation factor IIB [Candidatus Lokiarchaeota archaeon]|nr:transcription initiation factor IIB [Candidatus Lokiarchaeota archaeon]
MESKLQDFQANVCPECKGLIISIDNTGDVLCSNCGLVLNEKVVDFTNSGKRAYTKQEKASRDRLGSPITNLTPDLKLTTVIDRKEILNPDLKRAAKWDTRMPWSKRNLLIATTELKRISSNLDLPQHIKTEAMKVYREAFKNKLLRGRSINSMIAASIYYACRIKKVPITLQEILGQSDDNDKDVRRAYRALIKELKLKAPNTNPRSLIPKFIAELNLNNEVERIADKIVDTFSNHFPISGKDPKGICAGAIYIATRLKNLDFTQKEIAEKIGITEITLRSRYKELKTKLNIKFPSLN